jgi:hypothetical protein
MKVIENYLQESLFGHRIPRDEKQKVVLKLQGYLKKFEDSGDIEGVTKITTKYVHFKGEKQKSLSVSAKAIKTSGPKYMSNLVLWGNIIKLGKGKYKLRGPFINNILS